MAETYPAPDSAVLRGYVPAGSAYDECIAPDGTVRPHWRYVMQALEALGAAEVEQRGREARRMVREQGITYTVYGDVEAAERSWALDPIPVLMPSAEWQRIEQALVQRAELLELVLADLYGAQTLLRRGLLPPEVVYGHGGYARPCVGAPVAGGRALPLYAADLARGPDGAFCVLGDRAQAPSGAAYALENRVILSRVLPSVFRDAHVHRLPSFFRRMRTMLGALAPDGAAPPHVVLLTPGPGNETYFEHAYLAHELGCTLAQGDDLIVRDQRLWLRVLDGASAVDVVLRRVDGAFADPLELRGESLLGVAGLLQAQRAGTVAVVNPLGTSVVENPALMPFLPRLARELLGKDLALPSVPTWWCGDPAARRYVFEHLDALVIKPIDPHASGATVFGAGLDAGARARLAALVERAPHRWVGQEYVPLSTVPVPAAAGLEPRRLVVRAFLVADAGDYAVMPGGLCRVAPSVDTAIVSNQRGGISKDLWVLASEPERQPPLVVAAERPLRLGRGGQEVPGRVADNLYWVGRYAERAEVGARLLREVLRRLLDLDAAPYDPFLPPLLRALTQATATAPGFLGPGATGRLAAPEAELRALLFDPSRIGGLRFNLTAFLRASRAVRDRFSSDTWRVIGTLGREFVEPINLDDALDHLDRVLLLLAAFGGLSADSMSRGQRWGFLEIGRRLERALGGLAVLRALCPPGLAPAAVPWEALLSVADASITYRRRYRDSTEPGAVIDLLLDDDTNPRSVAYQLLQLEALLGGLAAVPAAGPPPAGQALVRDALDELRRGGPAAAAQARALDRALDEVLATLQARLCSVNDALGEAYFRRGARPQQLVRVV